MSHSSAAVNLVHSSELSSVCNTLQVAGQDRIAIIVPAEALPQFYHAVGLCLEERQATAQQQQQQQSSSQRPL